ncbi:MAG: NHL repeat-containing protein [Planctomycetota bacterium]|jgi:DNA-binding beta-propeller fold protein YncE
MKRSIISFYVIVTAVLVLAAFSFSGCQLGAGEAAPSGPILFPPPPDKPRLQFLKSFSNLKEITGERSDWFESFVLGEPSAADEQGISKPYGVAISEGKIYVCDVGKKMVEVIDVEGKTLAYLTKDRRLMNPVNIWVDDGAKYVADPLAGAVFVFDREDTLTAILGRELKITPMDIVVRGELCYVANSGSNNVVVLNKRTGEKVTRMGKEGDELGQIKFIGGLALDDEENIYVTDKIKARVTKFNKDGIFRFAFGKPSDSLVDFVRPKGIAIDREGRIWVVDTGTHVGKVYSPQGRLLMFFGLPGDEPGMMYMPTEIFLDYDNVELFREYAVEGAEIEFVVIVTNQFGSNKVAVYGFGSFPVQERQLGQKGEAE